MSKKVEIVYHGYNGSSFYACICRALKDDEEDLCWTEQELRSAVARKFTQDDLVRYTRRAKSKAGAPDKVRVTGNRSVLSCGGGSSFEDDVGGVRCLDDLRHIYESTEEDKDLYEGVCIWADDTTVGMIADMFNLVLLVEHERTEQEDTTATTTKRKSKRSNDFANTSIIYPDDDELESAEVPLRFVLLTEYDGLYSLRAQKCRQKGNSRTHKALFRYHEVPIEIRILFDLEREFKELGRYL